MCAHFLDLSFREMQLMTCANSKRRDLIGRATFFSFLYAVLPDPLSPLLEGVWLARLLVGDVCSIIFMISDVQIYMGN